LAYIEVASEKELEAMVRESKNDERKEEEAVAAADANDEERLK
jgi:hypothetical protein